MSEATRHVSKTGGAKDVKIERYDQIPAGPLAELAARYGVGSLKYEQKNGLDNWRNGYPWSWSYRALLGHANAFWGGEDIDPDAYKGTENESAYYPPDEDGYEAPRPGTAHLAAVAWHAFALLHWMETHPELDDRESTVLKRREAGLAATEQEAGELMAGLHPEPEVAFWKSSSGTPDPETIAALRAELAKPGHIVVSPDLPYYTRTVEDGKDYPIYRMYQLVVVKTDDGRVIRGAITGIRTTSDNKIRYDVTYNNGNAKLSWVPPAQTYAEH